MTNVVNRLIKSSAAALAVKVSGAVLSYLMLVALSRSMTMLEFGYFSFAFSVAVIAAKMAVGGQQYIVLRDIPRFDDGSDGQRLRETTTTRSYVTVFMLSAVLMLVLLGAAQTPPVVEASNYWPLLVGAFFVPIMAVSELQSSILRAHGSVVLAMAPREMAWRGLITVAGFTVVAVPAWQMSAFSGFLFLAVSLALITVLQAMATPATRAWAQVFDRGTLGDRTWRKESLHFWTSSVVIFGAPMLSVVVIGIFLVPVEAAAFFAALKTSQVISLVLLAMGIVASPMISRAFSKTDMDQVQFICTFCSGIATLCAGLAFAFLWFFGDRVLGLFGDGFASAYPELLILAAAYVVNAACGPNGVILEMTRHQDHFMKLILISNALGIVALPIATLLFGSVGTACAVAGTLVLWNVLAVVAANRYLNVDPSVFGVFRFLRNKWSAEGAK